MTTNWIVFQDIVKIVAVLEMLSGETMRAADDATLQKFENLCDHWKKMADAELALRARTK
jgi:hypothetical protein